MMKAPSATAYVRRDRGGPDLRRGQFRCLEGTGMHGSMEGDEAFVRYGGLGSTMATRYDLPALTSGKQQETHKTSFLAASPSSGRTSKIQDGHSTRRGSRGTWREQRKRKERKKGKINWRCQGGIHMARPTVAVDRRLSFASCVLRLDKRL